MPVGEQVNRRGEITLNEIISGTGLTSSSGHRRNSSWTRESGLTMVANTGCNTCSSQALKRCLPSECQVSGVFQYVCVCLKRMSRLSQCESIPLANLWITFLHGDDSCLLWGLSQDANQSCLKFTFIWPDWISSYQKPSHALFINMNNIYTNKWIFLFIF